MPRTLDSLAISTGKVKVPVHEKLRHRFGDYIVFQVASKGHANYPTGSVTLIAERLIQIMPFDAKEPTNSPSTTRKATGNNRFLHSNIHKWLNSEGAWYEPQHTYDAPPSFANVVNNPYDAWLGFSSVLPKSFVDALLPTSVVCALCNSDTAGTEEITTKMFLPSPTEIGLTTSPPEGTLLPMFTTEIASRIAKPTKEAVAASDYSSTSLAETKNWHWWLRTPALTSDTNVRTIDTTGALYATAVAANNGARGVRPMCNIAGSQMISDAPDTNNVYEFVWPTEETEEDGMKKGWVQIGDATGGYEQIAPQTYADSVFLDAEHQETVASKVEDLKSDIVLAQMRAEQAVSMATNAVQVVVNADPPTDPKPNMIWIRP